MVLFPKKKIVLTIIFHMPHWPMYLFWELSNSSFRAGSFLTGSAQTGLNWFLLSLKKAKPSTKKDIVFNIIMIFGPIFSSSFDVMMSTALKDTWRHTEFCAWFYWAHRTMWYNRIWASKLTPIGNKWIG